MSLQQQVSMNHLIWTINYKNIKFKKIGLKVNIVRMLNKQSGHQIKINNIWFKIKDQNWMKNNKICKNRDHLEIKYLNLSK
jgi:hypothetical protein